MCDNDLSVSKMPVQSDNIKKVLVLYTGGTIGMQKNEKGAYVPLANSLIEKFKNTPQLHDERFAQAFFDDPDCQELVIPYVHEDNIISYLIKEYDPLYDSCNMTTKDWIRIASDIEEYYEQYDGFVVLHGTDTLAYTASALSFILEGIRKPVIVTGAQIPIFETRNDAKANFLSSLILAACFDIPEVCVFFANKLLRGNRTAKVSTSLLDAFSSPNLHHLANVGIHINVFDHYVIKPKHDQKLVVNKNLNRNVVVLPLFPTITGKVMDAFMRHPIEGVVLQSYGVGNIPTNRNDLMDVLKKAIDRGVVIVNITQCSQGGVSPSYETGRILTDIGIIPGHDMTVEAALAKLSYVLGLDLPLHEKKRLVTVSLRGELTSS